MNKIYIHLIILDFIYKIILDVLFLEVEKNSSLPKQF